jgi:hypothetical protein
MNLSPLLMAVLFLLFLVFPFVSKGIQTDKINLALGFTVLWSLAFNGKEKDLLIRLFGKQFFYVFKMFESLMLLLPFWLALFINGNWIFAATLLVSSTVIHFVYSKSKTNFLYRFSLFHTRQFEWNSGLRKFFIPAFGLLFMFAYSLFYIPNDAIPFFLLYAFLLVLPFFQQSQEDVTFIQIFKASPAEFLMNKLKYSSIRMLFISLPLITLTWWLKPEIYHWVPVMIFVQSFVFLWISILNKYAYLGEEIRFEFLNSILFGCSLVPFLLPINLIYIVTTYKKAVNNLKPILC